jgi:hypothetical protein
MKPTDWAVILSEGQVNFSFLDRDLMAATVGEGFKELGQPFEPRAWVKKVRLQADGSQE